jgi:patatin-like phospholipase/acyl hydrolase
MYRILSVDGGGMHGYASVILMKRLFEKKPDLFEKVDLLAGTSIGGILTLGIATNHSIYDVEANFLTGIPIAFKTNCLRLIAFAAGMCPKYDNSGFKDYLHSVYGNKTLGELNKKIVITTFCVDNEAQENRRWKAKIFHNFDGSDSDNDFKVVDAAMATSAVPAFFPMYDKYIDGAFASNNPALIALTQTQDKRAIIEPRPSLNDISILSIGSIQNQFIAERNTQWGYFNWVKPILHLSTEKDILMTNYQCKALINDNFHRIQPVINADMDNFEQINTIKSAAMEYDINDTLEWLDKHW